MDTLPVAADAALLIRAGGATAILSGAVALTARKGRRLHAKAGTTFFVSMLVMASIGGVVALFLVSRQGDPKYFDSLAGFFTLYLVVSGWMTMHRRPGTIDRAEVAAFVYVSLLVAAAVLLGARAGGNAGGRGTPVPLVS